MTISAKLQTINTALGDIKEAIISKGQTPSGNITTYATAIGNIAGGGETIQATNQTGSNVSENDKVWVNSYYYEAGNSGRINVGENRSVAITANGSYVFQHQNLYSTNNVNLGTCISDVDLYPIQMCDCPDGVTYSYCSTTSYTQGMQRIDSGLGWSNTTLFPIKGTSEYALKKYDNYRADKIVKINPNTGEILKTYTKPSEFTHISFSGTHSAYIGNDRFIVGVINGSGVSGVSGWYIITLDDVNNTWTYTSTSILPSGYDRIVGVTSDYKYVLATTNRLIDTSSMSNVYDALDFPCTIDGSTYFDSKENVCQRHDGTLAYATGKNYKIVKYNPETQTWHQISLDYETIMGNTDRYFYRACFENGEVTRVFYSASNSYYNVDWKPTTTQGGYNLVKYGLETTNQTLTGFAAENINTGSTGEINITLPQKLNVSFTVDANDATIITE